MCLPGGCLYQSCLIPMGRAKVVVPKNGNALALTFTRAIWGTNFDVPKKRSIDLEGRQSGIWRCVGRREGRKRKQEREACVSTHKASFLGWIWKSGVGWLWVLSLEGKRHWVVIFLYFLLVFTME